MKYQMIFKLLVPILCLAILVGLTGCATSSNRKTRGSRGSLSDATAEAAGQEEQKGRGEGRTRTKGDGGTYNNDDSDYEVYDEEESDGGTPFLIGLILSIFSGGDDDEDESYDNRQSYPSEYGEAGDRAWNSYSEFGPYEDGDEDEEDSSGEKAGDKGGSGLDIRRSNLNAWYSRSWFAGDTIENFSTVTLMYSVYRGTRYRANIGLYFGRGNPGSQGNLEEALRWINEWGLDIGARGYLTPDHSLMGVYVLLGLRLGVMNWSYTNAITVPDGTGGLEQISNDGVALLVPYLGIGTSLLQTKSVHLGINFTVGGRMTGNKTMEDFDNDVFQNIAEYKLNFEASIFF